MSFQTRKSVVHFKNTIEDILDESQEACDCPIECQVIKSMKDIIKIVHLPSVIKSEKSIFYLSLCTKSVPVVS